MVRKTTSEEGTAICNLFFLTNRIIYRRNKWELHGIFFLIFLYMYRFSFTFSLKGMSNNKPIGRLMLYSISSSSEVIRKNVQNISC